MDNKRSMYRTLLTAEERKQVKALAKAKGMTLTGYTDSVIREAVQREGARYGISCNR